MCLLLSVAQRRLCAVLVIMIIGQIQYVVLFQLILRPMYLYMVWVNFKSLNQLMRQTKVDLKSPCHLFAVFAICQRKSLPQTVLRARLLRTLKPIRWLLLMHSVCSMMNKIRSMVVQWYKNMVIDMSFKTRQHCHLRKRRWMAYIICHILASGILNMIIRAVYQH